MDQTERFYELIQKEMAVTLATACESSVTMRLVSPVYYKGDILIFTAPTSRKYQQLQANPNCCLAVGPYFAEATATFYGSTMLDANKELRDAYRGKFHDAFDEGIAFGGGSADFILLKPTKLTGWAFENDTSTADGVPTIPFSIDLR